MHSCALDRSSIESFHNVKAKFLFKYFQKSFYSFKKINNPLNFFKFLCLLICRFDPIETMQVDSRSHDCISHINGLFPKITNLEYFPINILLNIFEMLDDNSLLYVASTGHRFDAIAQTIFKEKYANTYFVIPNDLCNKQQQQKRALINYFGKHINGIEANGLFNIDENHWMIEMLNEQPAINLKKIRFIECHFKNADSILSQYIKITHLTFQKCTADTIIQMPVLRDLKHFEVRDCMDIHDMSYKRIIKHCSQLESLIICNYNADYHEIIPCVSKYLKKLRKLNLANESDTMNFLQESSNLSQNFLDTVKRLDSLGISVDSDSVPFLKWLRPHCKNITDIELVHINGEMNNEMIAEIRSFNNITTLSLRLDSYQENFEFVLKSFSHLRELAIAFRYEMSPNHNLILPLMRECNGLEKITIDFLKRYINSEIEMIFPFIYEDDDQENEQVPELVPNDEYNPIKCSINVQFYAEFIEIMKNRHAKLELKENGKTIAMVSKYEVIWRNMLVHWWGYDAIHSRSDINLLDLAKTNENDAMNAERQQPFDMILDYLDINSLHSLYNTNQSSKQLVTNYMEKQSTQHKKLIVTDEFDVNYDAIRTFGHYVTNLEVNVLNDDIILRRLIRHCCINVQKLHLNQKCKYHNAYHRYKFVFPQLRHFIYSSANAKTIFNLANLPPSSNLESIEFNSDIFLLDNGFQPNLFSNLKRIKFKRSNFSVRHFVNDLPKSIINVIITN